jgi:cell division protein FtsQ
VSAVSGQERPRTAARAHALPLRRPSRPTLLQRWLPSRRSLAVGVGLLLAGGGAYLAARETSIFSLDRVEVQGAPPALAQQIRTALAPLAGTSLVTFSSSAADRRLSGLPQIAHVRYDRDFPHTLRLFVQVEPPVAVLREGTDGWLVSASGRVLAGLGRGSYPPLPRIWLAAGTDVAVGAPIAGVDARLEVASLLRIEHLPGRVLAVQGGGPGRLALGLSRGQQIRLGDTSNLRVKLAIAAAILPRASGASYVDVSVPTRPVAGYSTTASGATNGTTSVASTASSAGTPNP